MTREPTIPMSPTELPQQRLNPVVELPPRPESFDSKIGWKALSEEHLPKGGPRNATHLGQVEWAWSPAHSRVSSY